MTHSHNRTRRLLSSTAEGLQPSPAPRLSRYTNFTGKALWPFQNAWHLQSIHITKNWCSYNSCFDGVGPTNVSIWFLTVAKVWVLQGRDHSTGQIWRYSTDFLHLIGNTFVLPGHRMIASMNSVIVYFMRWNGSKIRLVVQSRTTTICSFLSCWVKQYAILYINECNC